MSSILNESQNFDNEVLFCNIFSQRDKKELERIFLKNRISYYIDWQKQSLWQRLFSRKGSDRINCFVKINRSEVEKAYSLVKNIEGLKFKDITGDTERRAVTKRALMDEAEDLDDDERD